MTLNPSTWHRLAISLARRWSLGKFRAFQFFRRICHDSSDLFVCQVFGWRSAGHQLSLQLVVSRYWKFKEEWDLPLFRRSMASHAAGAQWGLRESNCQIVSGLMITWCPLCDQRSFCTWTILLCPLPGKVSSVRLCRRSTHQGIRRRDMRSIASPVAWLIGGNQGYYSVRSNALLETFSLWSSCCTGRDVTQLLPFPLVVQEWKARSCPPFAIPLVVLC